MIAGATARTICGTTQYSPGCNSPDDTIVEKPSAVTVIWNGPGGTLAKENCPSSPEVVCCPADGSERVNDTRARATAAPVESSTVPVTVPGILASDCCCCDDGAAFGAVAAAGCELGGSCAWAKAGKAQNSEPRASETQLPRLRKRVPTPARSRELVAAGTVSFTFASL